MNEPGAFSVSSRRDLRQSPGDMLEDEADERGMKKRSLLRILESCVFLLLLWVVMVMVSGLLERKNSRNLLGGFLEEPQLYDVLFFGDSQLMNAMIPLEMWEDYGIAGYNLSSYGNSPPLSYWMMINAFDYAQPELVVIAVTGMNDTHKISRFSSDLHMATDFWPLTVNKARMLDDLLDDPEDPDFKDAEGSLYRELKGEFLFPLGKYHSRWHELTKDDFSRRRSYVKGGESLVGVYPIWDYELVDEENYAEEIGYSYAYLRRSIEECQRRGIDVLLIHLPNPQIINSQRHANTARSIADEYGIDFVDATSLDSIVDYAVDCYDPDPHLNLSGTQKMTDYLGSYLRDRYHLPDRRSDPDYAHWYRQLDTYKDEKIRVLAEQEDIHNALMLLHDKDFDVSLALFPPSPVYQDDGAFVLIQNIAREHVLAGEEYAKWSNMMFPLPGLDEAICEEKPYYLNREGGAVTEYTGERAEQAALEAFGTRGESTLLIRAVDRRDGSVAAQLQF